MLEQCKPDERPSELEIRESAGEIKYLVNKHWGKTMIFGDFF